MARLKRDGGAEWLPPWVGDEDPRPPPFIPGCDRQTAEAFSLPQAWKLPSIREGASFQPRSPWLSPLPTPTLTSGASRVSIVAQAVAASAGSGVCNCNHFLPQLALGLAPPLRTVGAGPRYHEGVRLVVGGLRSRAALKGNQLRLIKGEGALGSSQPARKGRGLGAFYWHNTSLQRRIQRTVPLRPVYDQFQY